MLSAAVEIRMACGVVVSAGEAPKRSAESVLTHGFFSCCTYPGFCTLMRYLLASATKSLVSHEGVLLVANDLGEHAFRSDAHLLRMRWVSTTIEKR